MNGTSSPSLPPASGGALDRFFARLLGGLVWAALALMGLVFLASLLVWLAVMVVASLVSSLFTGRPATVTLLWRRYREMARQRWPRRPGADSTTPRADATQATAAEPAAVQDVVWRDVPAEDDARR
ncbi:MAG: hypothetical protein QM772_04010 [Ottowia sp.]|uniref:hypothetical protein n=1 Tax=Ottowia sp. TaxID=1898956 RepID=UPI0039E5D2B2